VKKIIVILLCLSIFLIPTKVNAIYDPLLVENNKIGVHILFPDEIKDAKELINSQGGDWGYITIPIQSYDKDLEKWQKFMDQCREYHLIPIIRLATNGDYFNTKVWEKPKLTSILDFANFLNSLDWPTKNRYIVVFNEVNRGDEWGGCPEPKEYAELLSYAVTVFKSKSPDFFVISSGMDNASIDNLPDAMNKFTYFLEMEKAVPGIFNQIDGLGSHAYPNPGFSTLPSVSTHRSIYSFRYEKDYIKNFTSKDLPVFITETGWTLKRYTDSQIGKFYDEAFKNAWGEKDVIAVTPFILKAMTEPFDQFSMFDKSGNGNEIFNSIKKIKKVKGNPQLAEVKKVLGEKVSKQLPIRVFKKEVKEPPLFNSVDNVIIFLKWVLKIN